MPNSETGFSLLPDVGHLQYNGVIFSALYKSTVTGEVIADEAHRVTKIMRYVLEVQGIVTLPEGQDSQENTWLNLRKRLTVAGAPLVYRGNGFGGLAINVAGGQVFDIAYGPVPELLAFKPLGSGHGSEIHWRVTVRIPEILVPIATGQSVLATTPAGKTLASLGSAGYNGPVLQFNYETSLTFDEDGYAGIGIRGTLEVPIARGPQQARSIQRTVDDYRQRWMNVQIDLTQFRVTRRSFQHSRDKRTCEFEFAAEELAPMGLPPGATKARGRMSVRGHPIAKGGGKFGVFTGVAWTVSLTATYTIHKKFQRRASAWAFYALMWFRMHSSDGFPIPSLGDANNGPQQPPLSPGAVRSRLLAIGSLLGPPGALGLAAAGDLANWYNSMFKAAKGAEEAVPKERAAILTDFGFDEGLYEDSRTMTFNASWVLLTTFRNVLEASGVWNWLPNSVGGNAWATSLENVSGWRSFLDVGLDPQAEVIVDFGGGRPLDRPPFRTGAGAAPVPVRRP